jgi:4a-hydroxytetrahydrobiopterin dehydratase
VYLSRYLGRVSTLASEHCESCEKGTPPLPEEEAARLGAEVPAWQREGNQKLRREFSFPNFREAFGFVARAALVAEAEGHHPDIELGWGRAAFELTTHAASGLTRNDFVMAAKLDRLAQEPAA